MIVSDPFGRNHIGPDGLQRTRCVVRTQAPPERFVLLRRALRCINLLEYHGVLPRQQEVIPIAGRRDWMVKTKDIILYLLFAGGMRSVSGRTRLQKMLFLLENEGQLDARSFAKFGFEPWKYGPFSKEASADVEFLENAGLVQTCRIGPAAEPEWSELEELSQDYADDGGEYSPEQLFAQEEFSLTDRGAQFVRERIESRIPPKLKQAIADVKKKYNRMSLTSLLRYVYAKYPQYAVKSELRHFC